MTAATTELISKWQTSLNKYFKSGFILDQLYKSQLQSVTFPGSRCPARAISGSEVFVGKLLPKCGLFPAGTKHSAKWPTDNHHWKRPVAKPLTMPTRSWPPSLPRHVHLQLAFPLQSPHFHIRLQCQCLWRLVRKFSAWVACFTSQSCQSIFGKGANPTLINAP